MSAGRPWWAIWRRKPTWTPGPDGEPIPDGDQRLDEQGRRAADLLNDPTRQLPTLDRNERGRLGRLDRLTPGQTWRGNGGRFS